MTPSISRRQLLCSLPPAAVAVFSGCIYIPGVSGKLPARFEVRPKDSIILTVVVTRHADGEVIYNQSHSFERGEVMLLDKETLQEPSYDIVLIMDDREIWKYTITQCEELVISVDNTGEVGIIEHLIC